MSNANDPRDPAARPGSDPSQPTASWPPQQGQASSQHPGQYPQQQYPHQQQPYPQQAPSYPGQQPYPGYQPYPQLGPSLSFTTSAGAVIGLGALAGALAYLFIAIPISFAIDAATLGARLDFLVRSLTGQTFGIPSVLFFLAYSALLGALAGAMRLGIRNGAAMIGAGVAFGLIVRTGLGFFVIAPLITGQVRLGIPLVAWVKLVLINGLWGLAVGAFLVLTTRR